MSKKTKNHTNTHLADINEIMLGYYLVDGDWDRFSSSSDIRHHLKHTKSSVSDSLYDDECGRAIKMAESIKVWLRENNYRRKIKRVWWISCLDGLDEEIRNKINSKSNPSDIILEFTNGELFGISAKSTKRKNKKVAVKNFGLGTIEKLLGVQLSHHEANVLESITREDLPQKRAERKLWLRNNKHIQDELYEYGMKALVDITNSLHSHMCDIDQAELKSHLAHWFNSHKTSFPTYIKVTGRGTGGDYSVDISDPINNSVEKLIRKGEISLSCNGTTITVYSNSVGVLRIRAKYESEKLASPLKFSGEPI